MSGVFQVAYRFCLDLYKMKLGEVQGDNCFLDKAAAPLCRFPDFLAIQPLARPVVFVHPARSSAFAIRAFTWSPLTTGGRSAHKAMFDGPVGCGKTGEIARQNQVRMSTALTKCERWEDP